jgi:hypothetical protein
MKSAAAFLFAALMTVPAAGDRRVFSIRAVDDSGRVLYSAEIEGPPATDFTVALRDAQHEVDAAFVNEPRAGGGLDTRIHLRSRRAYGLSRNGLPLWEEDSQDHRLRVDLDQEIEMLPFGKAGDAGLLKLIIAPHAAGSPSPQPLQIRIGQELTRGAIQVSAYLEPHWFDADVTLARAGRVIATGHLRTFLGEAGTVALNGFGTLRLTPSPAAGDRRQFVAFTIDGAWSGAGIAPLGGTSSYTINSDTQLTVKWRAE